MSNEVIISALLVIASVIAVVAFVNAILPSVQGMAYSYNSLADDMEVEVTTDMDIIFISSQGDNISVWIKNVGSSRIPLSHLSMSDFFITSSSAYWHPNFQANSTPTWDYTLENGGGDTWDSGETIMANIELSSLPSDTYNINFVLYNGVSDSDIFSK